MPTLEDNRRYWGSVYDWPEHGDEWSAPWGDAATHWHATILPRVWPFLPAHTVLEIAPGFGRWTGYLIDASERYVGIDLAESCIAICKERFQRARNANFFLNDGRSLEAVEDDSIDFAFTFDSLVHAEADVIEDYLKELRRTLSPHGIAFIHHSNAGEYAPALRRSDRIRHAARFLPLGTRVLQRVGMIGWDQSRAHSMTAGKLVDFCEAADLICVGQEIINWGPRQRRLVDCLSLVTRPNSRWQRSNIIVRNPHFWSEAQSARALARVFTSLAQDVGEVEAALER